MTKLKIADYARKFLPAISIDIAAKTDKPNYPREPWGMKKYLTYE